jgi:nucleoside-diphosphate-sugar epimerase
VKILVTGGSGFIGKNIAEAFATEHNVLAPSHNELDLTDDAAVREYLRSHPIDIIIHSATKPGHRNAPDPTHLIYNNTRMYFNLVRNADCFGRMIFLSSGAVYDLRHCRPKMVEEYFDSHVPADDHGFSKYICVKHMELLDNITELRLFGVFGKYEDYAIRFISNAICKTLFDLPITLRQNRYFDYLYIDDLMPVLDYFIFHKGSHKSYNITPNHVIGLKELAEKVKVISGKDLPIFIAQDGMGVEYSGNNGRLRKEIPTLSFTPIDSAIKRLYSWYEENRHMLVKEALLVDK